MRRSRVIPCLTILKGELVKTSKFRAPRYIGDPINAVKLFNEMEVDELLVVDIGASASGASPDRALIESMAGEAFMPIAYGGGVSTTDEAAALAAIGVEKIVIDSAGLADETLITSTAARLGNSSTVGSITVKRDWLGRQKLFDPARKQILRDDPVERAKRLVELGAGELFVNDADRDGTYRGFDLALIQSIAEAVEVPVIACGGAGSVADLAAVVSAGASAAAAGSLFMFMGAQRGVLINYPEEKELASILP